MTSAAPAAPEIAAGPRRVAGGRRWRAGSVLTWLAIALVAAAALVALLAPWLTPHDPLAQKLLLRNRPPLPGYWLGTDHLGRDILSRLLVGLRLSLFAGVLGVLIAGAIGAGLGLLAAAAGGPVRAGFFGFIDVLRALPGVLAALVLVAAFGPGLWVVCIALGLTFAPTFAWVTRIAYEREMGSDYVEAVRGLGAGRLRVAFDHVLPNIAGPLVTQAAIVLPRCIVTESVLSFLGLGVAPDTPTWGRMIAQATRWFEPHPIAVLAPMTALAALTMALVIVGDGLRRRLEGSAEA